MNKNNERRELILDEIDSLVSDFVFYDRKEDTELGMFDIDDAIVNKEISIEEIVKHFEKCLREGLMD